MNTIGSVEAFGRDLRYALRALGRHRSFTLAVVMTLAVGLGANTAIFAVVDGVLIKPLPYPDAEQLVSLAHDAPGIKIDDLPMSPTQYFTYRDEGRVFQYLGLYADRGTTITGSGEPEQVAAVIATHDVLQALGVRPVLGRLFTEEDATTAAPAPQTMVLTYGYWQRRFGGDRSIVGRRLAVDSRPAEIVGVLPEGFRFLDMKPQPEILLPMRVNRAGLQIDNFGLRGLARLKPGATIAEANADVARMLPLWLNAWPIPSGPMDRAAMENWRIAPRLKPLKDDVVGGIGDMLWFLTGTIGIVLLIACANVANLMLVRSEGRRQEFAVRRALGAGGRQIARGVLTESVVIALAGGALGVGLAYLGVTLLIATAPATLPRLDEISLDPRVVVFAIVISLASSLLFGLIPAFKHARGHQSPMPNVVREGSASRER
jgi:putative ABC transport system permease protein